MFNIYMQNQGLLEWLEFFECKDNGYYAPPNIGIKVIKQYGYTL